ncbi:myotubularin-related protein 3 isoform X2 [Dendroctonus ponderosae]|uniref:myotubularin-related protein 3 isoform X2 n=1 Tax=Dendroctonus ponderosae TaxID=77166 RepID=UPI002034DCD5|nr:myotubularin-related protein 3 isoform X2 [Dendroctonus ponderosae]XP_048522699.1 myotubularin-related protein 3 isoform X2 [Dendroctonus ponderosae]
MDTVDQPNSICHVQSIHMYPLPPVEAQKAMPFGLLVGEMVLHSGTSVDGLIFATNYRLYLQNGENQYHIPLGMIEIIEIRELFYLQLYCKDARTYKCTFENNESALDWYNEVSKAIEPPRHLEQLFAFCHCAWAKEKGGNETALKVACQKKYTFDKNMFENEMYRMQFQGDSWRITKANENFKICPTYPPYLLVPSCINDEMLESVAKFRSSRRIPVAVWRHTKNGAVIARCSQPEVGWFGWRSSDDEDLLKAISDACNFDRNLPTNSSSSDRESTLSNSPGSLHSDESLQITGEVIQQEKKLLIMDARSYTTAVANRARGGGCECPEYYPNCEIQFMNLANIHSIRKSFHALRQLCMSSAEQPNWFSLLEGTRWLSHMSGLMKSAVILSTAVERDGRPVLVHCSDGWDRTPQIVALAELLLDPYYRTVDGFRVLIEREWLAFGHKFADRCGHSGGSADLNERCPVFLQWLDCIHQLIRQFPVSFEFSHNYLIKLAQHTFSNLYGTFLCNTHKQRSKIVHGRTFSVWDLLSSSSFKNHLYAPTQSTTTANRVLWPKTHIRDLRLWSEVYLGSLEANFNPEEGSGGACPGPPDMNGHINMSKTRSYGDLLNGDACHVLYGGRRSSDPSINRELKLVPHGNGATDTINNTDVANGHHNHNESTNDNIPDFLPSDMEDNAPDCEQDCIFRIDANPTPLTDDQIDGLSFDCGYMQPKEINSETNRNETDELSQTTNEMTLNTQENVTNSMASIFLADSRVDSKENAMAFGSEAESTLSERGSETENNLGDEEFLENNISPASGEEQDHNNCINSRDIENDLCRASEQVERLLSLEPSVETSTETLVSDQLVPGSSPNEYNGFEKIRSPIDIIDGGEDCKICVDGENVTNGNSATESTGIPGLNGWDGACMQSHTHKYRRRASNCQLGEDGLIPIRSPIEERLDQIVEEHRRKIELLERELHASRQILIKQACHRCQNGDGERHDDSCSSSIATSSSRSSCCSKNCLQLVGEEKLTSVIESLNSAGESHVSAGESLRSDLSWVDVEESVECQGTLWVPDHAVSRCTGCGTAFWMGRRRHHCRKCGRIFCADCSEHATPLPSEQLYNPVRVCTGCYSDLKQIDRPLLLNSISDSLAEQCSRGSSGSQESQRIQTQIAASSN